jgi:hypothetical protein
MDEIMLERNYRQHGCAARHCQGLSKNNSVNSILQIRYGKDGKQNSDRSIL